MALVIRKKRKKKSCLVLGFLINHHYFHRCTVHAEFLHTRHTKKASIQRHIHTHTPWSASSWTNLPHCATKNRYLKHKTLPLTTLGSLKASTSWSFFSMVLLLQEIKHKHSSPTREHSKAQTAKSPSVSQKPGFTWCHCLFSKLMWSTEKVSVSE